jgi:predicted nucleic acid-binding protein
LSTLVDTNVLLRQFEPAHDHHGAAVAATMRLIESGDSLHVATQSIAEFWAVATRPAAQNGLGLDVALASSAIAEIERTFEVLLSDEAIVYPHWRRLIVEQRVTGRRVFDARLVAVMLAHGVGRLLTFNGADFAGLGIEVLEPRTVRSA